METSYDLLIRGGTLVTGSASFAADLAIRNSVIAAIGPSLDGDATRTIDATGRYVLPGGVDPHAHIQQMSGAGLMNADTFETAHRSALIGGTTSVISFAAQPKGTSLTQATADYGALARAGAMADYAFHQIVADPSGLALDLPELAASGHRSLKIFTTYPAVKLDDRQIIDTLMLARAHGYLACIHAETDALIGWTTDALLARGLDRPHHHALSHPRLAEIDAVERMIRFAEFTGAPIMLFHISTAEAAEAVRRAKARGVAVHAETCPHYLLMTDEVLTRPEAAKWMCSPPQRTRADQDTLWAALADGTLDLISSDHAPYRHDATGKLAHGAEAPFNKIANGLPGLETRLPLIWDAIATRGLPPELFVRLCCEGPARLHGLSTKGHLAEGQDADILIWNAGATREWSADDLHDSTGYNPWAGHVTRGAADTVIRRGEVVVEGGALKAEPGSGRFLPRAAFPAGQPAHEARIAMGDAS